MKKKTDFSKRVYLLLNQVPFGKVVSYKQIAEKIGSHAYRAVGNCLNKNKNLVTIPCHRVIKTNGDVGEYVLGRIKKIKLLKKEGIEIINEKIDMNRFGYKF